LDSIRKSNGKGYIVLLILKESYHMKKILAVAITSILATSAMAESAFEGLYGQLGLGYGSDSVSSTPFTAAGNSVSTGSGSGTNGQIAIGVGYNFAVSDKYLIGIGAQFDGLSNTFDNTANLNSNIGSVNGFKYTTSNRLSLFVTPSYEIASDKLVYLKAGVSSQSVKVVDASTDTSYHNSVTWGQTWGTKTATGSVLGLGYKQLITKGLYGFGELNFYNYSGINLSTVTAGTAVTNFNPTSSAYQVIFGLGYKF
jgi:outer membrane immunogenic protein